MCWIQGGARLVEAPARTKVHCSEQSNSPGQVRNDVRLQQSTAEPAGKQGQAAFVFQGESHFVLWPLILAIPAAGVIPKCSINQGKGEGKRWARVFQVCGLHHLHSTPCGCNAVLRRWASLPLGIRGKHLCMQYQLRRRPPIRVQTKNIPLTGDHRRAASSLQANLSTDNAICQTIATSNNSDQ